MSKKIFVFSVVLIVLNGCAKMKPIDFKNTIPLFVLEEYFEGKTNAWGIFEDRFGNIRRQFSVDITGTWDGKKLVLDEHVLMVKGPTTSTNSEAIFNYLNELSNQGNGLVVHSSSAGAPGLGEISQWGFRNSFAESYALSFLVENMVKHTCKHVGKTPSSNQCKKTMLRIETFLETLL